MVLDGVDYKDGVILFVIPWKFSTEVVVKSVALLVQDLSCMDVAAIGISVPGKYAGAICSNSATPLGSD